MNDTRASWDLTQHICQSVLQLTPMVTVADTTDWFSWKSYVPRVSGFFAVSGWLVLQLFHLQPHAVKVLPANTLLDLNNIRCESSEGEYQDGSDSTFLFFQRNWRRCWTIGLGQGNSGYDFSDISVDGVVIYFQMWWLLDLFKSWVGKLSSYIFYGNRKKDGGHKGRHVVLFFLLNLLILIGTQ